MTFQNPELLWLLLLLVVPILLFLLRLPRRRVASSALFLWERFLRTERFGRASERLRRALGFALFFAILTSLILAAAGPRLGPRPLDARRLIVLIDASASMNAVSNGISNFDRARAAAARLVESLDSDAGVTIAEAGRSPRVLGFWTAGHEAAQKVWDIQPFHGRCDLRRVLEELYRLVGGPGASVHVWVFTDRPLPENPWGDHVHAWIAPPAGDNAAIVALSCERRGRQVVVRFTLANFGATPRTLAGRVLLNGTAQGSFRDVALRPGETVARTLYVEGPDARRVEVILDGNHDALEIDDGARAVVPSLDDLQTRVVWSPGARRNAYVQAALSAIQDEGLLGPATSSADDAALTVFVNQMPEAWPKGSAIVLYPLRSGVVEVAGLRKEPIAVTRQAQHPLLRDVDFRGLTVKGAVQATPPEWASALVWAEDLPLIWAGETRGTKVLCVGIPLTAAESRLPLTASFPVLMQNAVEWMVHSTSVLRPGERAAGWTSPAVGFHSNPHDGRVHAFSVLSAEESDLRRAGDERGEAAPTRRRVGLVLVFLAIVLLPIEWGLFHRRLTE